MVNYWKEKLLPKIKKAFENPKKTAALEASKTFDEAKEGYAKECQEKRTELQPKVVEIYEASGTEIKSLVKEPKDAAALKKNSAAVQKLLDELAKIDFPGSKAVSEAATKVGPGYLPGPIFFVFEKVSTFIEEPEKKEEPAAAEAEAAAPPPEHKDKEVEVVAEEKKEEAAAEPVAEVKSGEDAAVEAPKA